MASSPPRPVTGGRMPASPKKPHEPSRGSRRIAPACSAQGKSRRRIGLSRAPEARSLQQGNRREDDGGNHGRPDIAGDFSGDPDGDVVRPSPSSVTDLCSSLFTAQVPNGIRISIKADAAATIRRSRIRPGPQCLWPHRSSMPERPARGDAQPPEHIPEVIVQLSDHRPLARVIRRRRR